MLRIERTCELLLMAGYAQRRRSLEHIVLMATVARCRLMRPRELERRLVMIKRCRMPARHRMARKAVGRVAAQSMVGRLRGFEISLMATETISPHVDELIFLLVLMA